MSGRTPAVTFTRSREVEEAGEHGRYEGGLKSGKVMIFGWRELPEYPKANAHDEPRPDARTPSPRRRAGRPGRHLSWDAARPDEANCECHWGSAEDLALLKMPDVELDPDLLRRTWEAADWEDPHWPGHRY